MWQKPVGSVLVGRDVLGRSHPYREDYNEGG
jgi:hypothetical protein